MTGKGYTYPADDRSLPTSDGVEYVRDRLRLVIKHHGQISVVGPDDSLWEYVLHLMIGKDRSSGGVLCTQSDAESDRPSGGYTPSVTSLYAEYTLQSMAGKKLVNGVYSV
ncbi:hypothetical protein PGTUg99_004891 [Puccinia graminis f. sp. tritici]|uniref:Uncharacterized protein n=1 Tax=Puccinia graminis f. sp. tritici TaxID=56615 RepID=A0A5B0LJ48_PUCGR|nr:hypothetical protein PGTUg99_004891 [Puccinia graminis f. sp. tritici]